MLYIYAVYIYTHTYKYIIYIYTHDHIYVKFMVDRSVPIVRWGKKNQVATSCRGLGGPPWMDHVGSYLLLGWLNPI